jgi:hypothetical protein
LIHWVYALETKGSLDFSKPLQFNWRAGFNNWHKDSGLRHFLSAFCFTLAKRGEYYQKSSQNVFAAAFLTPPAS